MKSIHFFALQADILPVLEAWERESPLQYVATGNRTDEHFQTFNRAMDIPRLGEAMHESGIACQSYLVALASSSVTIRTIQSSSGATRYLIDQLVNPDTVTLTPAGRWDDDCIVSGQIGTASNSPESLALMKRFRVMMKARFTTIKQFWVGPEAMSHFNAGARFTTAVQSSREFDLTRE